MAKIPPKFDNFWGYHNIQKKYPKIDYLQSGKKVLEWCGKDKKFIYGNIRGVLYEKTIYKIANENFSFIARYRYVIEG